MAAVSSLYVVREEMLVVKKGVGEKATGLEARCMAKLALSSAILGGLYHKQNSPLES